MLRTGFLRNLAPLALGSSFLAGCALSPTPIDTYVESAPGFGASGVAMVSPRFWSAFDAVELDSLVTRALRANLDLRIADARRREAAAFVDLEESAYWPDLVATAGATGRTGEGLDESSRYELGLDSTVELDLFGAIGSAVEAERLRTAAAFAAQQAVELTVAADVATTWFRLLEARSQRALLDEQIETNQTVLELLRRRFGSGQILGVDILRQEQLVEATRQRRDVEQGRVATLENALAVLLGRAPRAGFVAPHALLPALPSVPVTGIPADLVQRRPDVRRNWLLLRAADRDLAASIARKAPRLSLTASVSTAAESPGALFEDWIGRLAGNLVAPLFTAGELQSAVDRDEAIRSRLLSEYTRAVLIAFREVEDALALERVQSSQIERLIKQADLSRRSTEQLERQYLNGLANYLDVLSALTEQQELQRNLITARRERLETRVALYRALAGPLTEDESP